MSTTRLRPGGEIRAGQAWAGTSAWVRTKALGAVPVLDLTLNVVGLPAVAAAGSWLLAGREPPTMARHAIE